LKHFIGWSIVLVRPLASGNNQFMTLRTTSRVNRRKPVCRTLASLFRRLGPTRLVWLITPKTRTAEIYTNLRQRKKLTDADSLEGGAVLPGLELPLRSLFARAAKRKTLQSGH
jgi:hypothetical protein